MGWEPFVPTFLRALPLARDALAFAERAHGGQRRESGQAAFVLHPIEVAALLHVTGHAETVVAAGILHPRCRAEPRTR
jgi:(p)ppGpp synthase/HD superfamily hydrolase